MKTTIAILASTLLVSTAAVSQTRPTNPRNEPPGQMMKDHGSVRGSPGASGYTPGHQMQSRGSAKNSPGASGYAPGHEPTGSIPRSR